MSMDQDGATPPGSMQGTTSLQFVLNDASVSLDAEPAMPVLWALRDLMGMTGTKFGCGIAACGACTVHVDGQPMRACVTPVSAIAGKHVTTIEGASGAVAAAVQAAWIALDVPQCGYCQSGQVMAAVALLTSTPSPTDAQIDAAMQGIICRCGTYPRIRAGIHRAAAQLQALVPPPCTP